MFEMDFQRDTTTMSDGLERLILGVQDYNWGKVGSTKNIICVFCILQVGTSSEVCKLLLSSGQWKDGEVEEGKSYAELWVIFCIFYTF